MKKSAVFIFISLLVSAVSALAGKTTFYTLDNGMEVILKENHAAPLISSVIIVKAGSKFENEENNGFTHLLEHMLFNGTVKRSRKEIDEGIRDYGGYINAFTRQEMTGYLVVMPREFIEYGFDIQSDQLFNSILPADQFPKERDIVVEEIKKDNDVAGNIAYDYFNSVKFKETPYARPVIGYEETIRNVTRDEVMKYYKDYYVPNNMTAFITGDFETDEMKRLVDKYYGKIPRGEDPVLSEFIISPPYDAKINIKRHPAKVSYIDISFPGPLYSESDYFAYDVLSQYLDSEASPLSNALTGGDDPLAVSVSVSLDIQSEFTMMDISIRTNKPENIDRIVRETLSVLKEITEKEFSESDIRRVVVPNKVNEIKLEEKLHYYGIMKAPYLATCGYEFLENYTDNLSKVKPGDIGAITKKYFARPRYVASALAPGEEGK
ncbi:MAG: insulinase family protein [Candidatus Zixiibacteriota bacterium]|nr:MAG: insulinase family protein [candidate division Zixibacteria bacterium]